MGCSLFLQILLLLQCYSNSLQVNLFNQPKVWWAKHISDYLFTAGRLSETEIKNAKESGFNSIISLYNHTHSGYHGDEYLPSTSEAQKLALDLVNIDFAVILEKPTSTWKNEHTIYKFRDVINTLKAPVLFYCNTGFSSSFIGLLYSLNNSYHFSIEDFYKKAAILGYDYTKNHQLKEIINEVSKESYDNLIKPTIVNTKWYLYHHQKPVFMNWFIAGQIQSNHIEHIIRSGIKTVINVRLGASSPLNNEPSQEEVTLLNIKDNVGTYRGDGRQSLSMLEINLLNSSRPRRYISENSIFNFERNNSRQFGDEIGYNESIERQWVLQHGLKYIHLPLDTSFLYDLEKYESYLDELKMAHINGPVLVHCNTGLRSLILGLIGAGVSYGKDRQWAIETVHQIGYTLNDGKYTQLLSLLDHAIENNKSEYLTSNDTNRSETILYSLYLYFVIYMLYLIGYH